VKQYIQRAFTGDKRGEALALGAPTKAQLLQYNMQGFDVGPIRDVSEERVCAAIGIPAPSSDSAPACSRRRSARR
jgi:hypothetical protein